MAGVNLCFPILNGSRIITSITSTSRHSDLAACRFHAPIPTRIPSHPWCFFFCFQILYPICFWTLWIGSNREVMVDFMFANAGIFYLFFFFLLIYAQLQWTAHPRLWFLIKKVAVAPTLLCHKVKCNDFMLFLLCSSFVP